MRGEKVPYHLFFEKVFVVCQPFADVLQVGSALREILRREFHDRILQQRQVSHDTIIAA